jgi:hypothetical protein
MVVNTAKTKFIVFRTRGKRINPEDCHLVFNSNEMGHEQIPDKTVPITRVYLEGDDKLIHDSCT